MNSIANGVWFNSQFPRPLGVCQVFPVVLNPMVRPRVVALHNWRSPATVAWLVVPIVIAAINAVCYWRITHIGVEIFEFRPSLADGDSSRTILMIFRTLWILTSLPHRLPDGVNPRVRFTMSEISLLTSAARRVSRSEMKTADVLCFSAVAKANPIKDGSSAWSDMPTFEADHKQMGESFPSQVYKFLIGWFTLAVSHVASQTGDVIRAVDGIAPIGGSFILAESHA